MQNLRIGSTVVVSYVYHNSSGGSTGTSTSGVVTNLTDTYVEIGTTVLPWGNIVSITVTTP